MDAARGSPRGHGLRRFADALNRLKTAEAAGHAISADNYAAAIAGAALSDPKSALDLPGPIPEPFRPDCTDDLISNAVRNGGTDALDQIMQFATSMDTSTVENDSLRETMSGEGDRAEYRHRLW